MTTESVEPATLHGWAICLRASEEARRRGDRRYGTDHILLALFEEPSIEALLGVSLQQARLALESLDRKPWVPWAWVSAPTHPIGDARRAEEAENQRRRAKDRLRITPAAKKVLEQASKPNRRRLYVTAQQVLAQILTSNHQILRRHCSAPSA